MISSCGGSILGSHVSWPVLPLPFAGVRRVSRVDLGLQGGEVAVAATSFFLKHRLYMSISSIEQWLVLQFIFRI